MTLRNFSVPYIFDIFFCEIFYLIAVYQQQVTTFVSDKCQTRYKALYFLFETRTSLLFFREADS